MYKEYPFIAKNWRKNMHQQRVIYLCWLRQNIGKTKEENYSNLLKRMKSASKIGVKSSSQILLSSKIGTNQYDTLPVKARKNSIKVFFDSFTVKVKWGNKWYELYADRHEQYLKET